MKVSDIYTPATVHIPTSCNLQDAAIQMRDQHVGALIATSGGAINRIAGIVTDRDIVLQAVAFGAALNDMLVADVMTPHVVVIGTDADLTDAMQTMSSHGVRRLAVTNAEQDIVGVLSLDDVIEAIGRDLVLLSSIVRCEQNRESSGSVQAPLHL
ncbi:CBS domain-containing protein [Paraburkholderia sp. NMBU_R16]|uniref:CBS domain-containing protein n=1 Tax=Paraburkholderia sp. NMBU_R16 TaxID=2698676 RepID=UPI001567088E|nr:CBS domain-containing protein [Paraburkholderia sp. NMBU_R16]NRO96964.1 CBS domain-containing protein [Paraburkholderia sp. NMBU_R16]